LSWLSDQRARTEYQLTRAGEHLHRRFAAYGTESRVGASGGIEMRDETEGVALEELDWMIRQGHSTDHL
jgi:hypothetical protein